METKIKLSKRLEGFAQGRWYQAGHTQGSFSQVGHKTTKAMGVLKPEARIVIRRETHTLALTTKCPFNM